MKKLFGIALIKVLFSPLCFYVFRMWKGFKKLCSGLVLYSLMTSASDTRSLRLWWASVRQRNRSGLCRFFPAFSKALKTTQRKEKTKKKSPTNDLEKKERKRNEREKKKRKKRESHDGICRKDSLSILTRRWFSYWGFEASVLPRLRTQRLHAGASTHAPTRAERMKHLK